MQRVMDRAGQSPLAARAGITLAESLEKREKYDEAYDIWSEINDIWSTGRVGRLSLLGMGRVKYLSFNGPTYDATCLVSAKSFYEDFQSRYSQRAEELQISERIEDINEKIARKKYNIAEYYKRTDSLQAANLYYRMVAEQWSDTPAGELAREALN
jgi:outer membrane protein assembly factor BamD (BamD/ComL family)